jgi:hypothetical protein
MILTPIGRDITPTNYGYVTHLLVKVHPHPLVICQGNGP